jgi:hypothetical protein
VSDSGYRWLITMALALGTGLFVYLLLKPLIAWLRRRAIMDIPNDRSSHVELTPRGGGIATTASMLLGLIVWMALEPDPVMPMVVLGMAVLGIVSWLDDRSGRPAGRHPSRCAGHQCRCGHRDAAAGGDGDAGARARLARAHRAVVCLDVVHQPVQLHGRDQRHHRCRDGDDRRRLRVDRRHVPTWRWARSG